MPNHLSSKTMAGLAAILAIAVGASAFGKLTPELVEVLKWVGGSFLAMRAVANVAEAKKSG
jgi:threonine/homoserine/homoserine lactone efflux protein